MGKLINEVGNIYGKLTVLSRAQIKEKTNEVMWLCQCECGNQIITRGSSLRSGKTKSCGKCLRNDAIDETGNRYGKLLVLEKSNNRTNSLTGTVWKCQCDCGAILDICGTVLRRPNGPKSCRSCSQKDNLVNKKFFNLTVIEEQPNNQYKCLCDCGNIITVKGKDLLRGHRQSCGCIKSTGEKTILQLLNDNNIIYETQKTFNNCRNPDTNNLLRFDFYLPEQNTLIEYDGEQHYFGWLKDEKSLIENQKKDNFKNQWCKDNNILLIRIPYTHLKNISLEDLLPETSQFLI